MTGIIDEPLGRHGNTDDTLGINKFSSVLANFVRETDTPMTIGIQGEWGSGKTSILNSIWNNLERDTKYLQIWVNTWEHSLMCNPEESLLRIIFSITDSISKADPEKRNVEKIRSATYNLMKGALRVGTTIALGDKAGQVLDEAMVTGDNSIREIREALEKAISDIADRPTNPHERIVIFVDDLDRLEPAYAVRILELLKNVFNVPHCVFFLAIDYQVVVKGLKEKFGELTEQNEWEFRAFFDKIIQLPFMMPMGDYNIGNYVRGLLNKIGFDTGCDLDGDMLSELLRLTIGGNPRSIKRLVNSLALISMLSDSAKLTRHEKIILFAVVCIQISYPKVYELLKYSPDFTTLNEEIAFEYTKGKESNDESFVIAFEMIKDNDLFDELWEQVIYRICFVYPHLRNRVVDISRLLNLLKDYSVSHKLELGDVITNVLNQTSITNVSSGEEATIGVKSPVKSDEEKQVTLEYWAEFLSKVAESDDKLFRGKTPKAYNFMAGNWIPYGRDNSIEVSFSARMNMKNVITEIQFKGDSDQAVNAEEIASSFVEGLRDRKDLEIDSIKVKTKEPSHIIVRAIKKLEPYKSENRGNAITFQNGVISASRALLTL